MAPALFRDLGFDVEAIGVDPDGRNINAGCGSTAMEASRRGCRRPGPGSAWPSTATATARCSSTTAAGGSMATR